MAMKIPAFDRALLRIAPGWARNRIKARLHGEILARHYEAASTGRRNANWPRSHSDANVAAGAALPTLRALSRDLRRNNPWARRGVQVVANNTVGWGIVPKAAGAVNSRLDAAWKEWAETTQCDADGRLTFYGIQRQAMETVAESGEVLIRARWRYATDGLALPLQLHVLEPDYIDTTRDNFTGAAGGPVIQGVEFDKVGRRVAYWLFPTHPGSNLSTGQSRRYPASDFLHVFRSERPGQVRGVPWLAAVIARLRDFDDYEDATISRHSIAALYAAFVTDPNGDPAAAAIGEQSTDVTGQPVETLEPGMIKYLAPGQTVEFGTPPVPADGGFTDRSLRAVAAGLGVTFEELTGNYCVAPETRVLRADLRWVRADALRVGDAIVAFDEHAPGGKGNRRKWRKAEVVRSGSRELNRRRIVTSAATVLVSDEHLFLCTSRPDEKPRRGGGLQARSENPGTPGRGQRWVRADRLRPGDRILFLREPWDEGATHTHGYLKGMADGEGHLCHHDAKIGIAQNPGPVFNETGDALRSLGFSPVHRQANGGGKVQQWSIMGIAECLRFLGEVRPTRLLAKAETAYVGRVISGGAKKSGSATYATVLSVEPVGSGPVVTLETSTRTLITEGLLSHNSNVNYSSGRLGWMAHWANVEDWRWNMLVPQFCAPAWGWAMQAAELAGLLGSDEYPRADWTPPARPMLDPDKEGTAYKRRVRSGAMTPSEMVREQGRDPDAHWREYAADLKKLDALGIIIDSDPRHVSDAGLTQARPTGTGFNDKLKDADELAGDEEKPAAEDEAEDEAEADA